jgi:basic membrane protein A
MYKNLINRRIAVVGALGAIFQANAAATSKTPISKPLKVGFLYVAPLAAGGWVQQHDLGRKAIEKAFGNAVTTHYVENVAEGPDAERVLRDMAGNGYGLVFTPSFGYMEPTIKVAGEFPTVKFESITGYKTAPNVAVANARYYEGRYLAGVAAGAATNAMGREPLAGYVAGFPIPEVLQGINAFTLGMQSVNPKARTKVIFLNKWFDPAAEREAAVTLLNQGCEVLAYHTGSNAVVLAAQAAGKKVVAYHSDLRHIAPDAQLLAVGHHWGGYYTQRVKAVLNGTWKSGAVWGGIAEGMVSADQFGTWVPAAVQSRVKAAQAALVKKRLAPFQGPIWSQDKSMVVAKGGALSDAQIASMNFLVAGVESSRTMTTS